MSQQQHTQEPVAEVCATSYRANDGDVHTMIEIRRLQNVKVGTLLYAFPPDAAARIAELEAYGRTRADEMLAATVRIAELERQHNVLLDALLLMKRDKWHWEEIRDAAIASMKGGAA